MTHTPEENLEHIYTAFDKGRVQYAIRSMWFTPFVLFIGFWLSHSAPERNLGLALILTLIFSVAFFSLSRLRNWLAEGVQIGVWFIFVPIIIRLLNPHDGAMCTGHVYMQACFTISLVVSFIAGIGLGGVSEIRSSGDKRVMLTAFAAGTAVSAVGCLVVGLGAFSGLALGMLSGVVTSTAARPLLKN